MRRLRVLLDANVLVDAQVRDLVLRLAQANLIEVRWSSAILEEVSRALRGRLHVDAARVDRLFSALDRAFPDAVITGYEPLQNHYDLPDTDDRHVLAAAVAGDCDILVTFNIADFPTEAPAGQDLLIASVDDFLTIIAGWFGDGLGPVIDAVVAPLRRPPQTQDEWIGRLGRRAPYGALAIGQALGIDSYMGIYQDVIDVGEPSSPHAAVQALLEALKADQVDDVATAIHPDLAERLTSTAKPTPQAITEALRRQLADYLTSDGWGFPTRKRLQGPSREIVKLMQLGSNEPVLITKPTLIPGHVFELEHDGSTWIITDLDFPDPTLQEIDPSLLE